MDFDTIAYKVESNTIVNATVVTPGRPLEEGFVKRNWPLGIGYVYNTKLKDYYPAGTTQENYDESVISLNNTIGRHKNTYSEMLDQINLQYFTPDANANGAMPEVSEAIVEQKDKMEKYLLYLETANTTIENPFYQSIKSYEEI